MIDVDAIVVGLGLAGAAVVGQLARRGLSAVVIDPCLPQTPSRVAAGLVTPVGGARLLDTWGWPKCRPEADSLYTWWESQTSRDFWRPGPALRLFATEEERALFHQSHPHRTPKLATAYPAADQALDAAKYCNAWGGFVMPLAATLSTEAYLDSVRDWLSQRGCLIRDTLNGSEDFQVVGKAIVVPRLDLQASQLVFATGAASDHDTWFARLPRTLSSGDVLRVSIAGLQERRTVHAQGWLTPTSTAAHEEYLVGSSYRWNGFDTAPGTAEAQSILDRLSTWCRREVHCKEHRHGLRSAGYDHHPLLGPSACSNRVWVLNGLGARGALWAPWCAKVLVDAMEEKSPIPREVDWRRRGA